MSESVVADFVAAARFDDADRPEPVQARVLLSEDRLVVASDGRRAAVDLASVFDVLSSHVPEEMGDYFDQTVLVGYVEDGTSRTVLIQGEHGRIDRFASFLYTATLRGSGATVTHPARAGGRVLETPPRSCSLSPTPDGVAFRGEGEPFRIDLEAVTDVSHLVRTVDGEARRVLAVRHRDGEDVLTTEIHHDSVRTLNVLARYLRQDYGRRKTELGEVAVDPPEAEALVALYAGGDRETVATVLDRDGDGVADLLAGLERKGLLGDDGRLTARGQIVVAERIEHVDA